MSSKNCKDWAELAVRGCSSATSQRASHSRFGLRAVCSAGRKAGTSASTWSAGWLYEPLVRTNDSRGSSSSSITMTSVLRSRCWLCTRLATRRSRSVFALSARPSPTSRGREVVAAALAWLQAQCVDLLSKLPRCVGQVARSLSRAVRKDNRFLARCRTLQLYFQLGQACLVFCATALQHRRHLAASGFRGLVKEIQTGRSNRAVREGRTCGRGTGRRLT